jgi:hypothetical protein
LELQDLQQAHLLAGRGDDPQPPVGGGEHQASGGDVEHLHAPIGEQGQDLNHVEVVNKIVSQLHQRLD